MQRARDVGVDEVPAGVRGHMRFVQSRGVDNGIHAAYAHSNEPPVDDRRVKADSLTSRPNGS